MLEPMNDLSDRQKEALDELVMLLHTVWCQIDERERKARKTPVYKKCKDCGKRLKRGLSCGECRKPKPPIKAQG